MPAGPTSSVMLPQGTPPRSAASSACACAAWGMGLGFRVYEAHGTQDCPLHVQVKSRTHDKPCRQHRNPPACSVDAMQTLQERFWWPVRASWIKAERAVTRICVARAAAHREACGQVHALLAGSPVQLQRLATPHQSQDANGLVRRSAPGTTTQPTTQTNCVMQFRLWLSACCAGKKDLLHTVTG